MAKRGRAKKESNEPIDWKVGQQAARQARDAVAEQLAEALVERDMTGGQEMFVRRVREIVEARETGDKRLFRAAVWEATLAGLAWTAELDLDEHRNRVLAERAETAQATSG